MSTYFKSVFNVKEVMVFIAYFLQYHSTAFSQVNTTAVSTIKNTFNQYSEKHLQEKLFVHTDKSFYLVGEILWFKTYCVDATFHKPLDISKVAYVEILDKENQPVLQSKIELKNGVGNGSFFLPMTLNNGNYVLRAYTNWLKNFDPDYFFEKQITIINSLKAPIVESNVQNNNYDVQFFPEGGNLVNGLKSKVGFKVINQKGKGVDFKGFIINGKKDTLVRFSPLKFGIGHFYLNPSIQNKYQAVIKLENNEIIIKDLPTVYENGFVMSLSEVGNEKLVVTVNGTLPDTLPVYLLVHSGQKLEVVKEAEMHQGVAKFNIKKDQLRDGISCFTLFNSDKQPVCERLFFNRPNKKLIINAINDAKEYASRKKVTVQINTSDQNEIPTTANISMGIYQLDSLQRIDESNIVNYLYLTSDLKGVIESPNYYFDTIDSEVDSAVDNLMLTHGWRRFKWENISKNQESSFKFLPEYSGHIITGKIINKISGKTVEGIPAYLSIPGKRIQFYYSKSNDNGIINFYTRNLCDVNQLILQTDSIYRMDIDDSYSKQFSKSVLPNFEFSSQFNNYILSHSIGMQVQNLYSGDKIKHFDTSKIDSIPFYGRPSEQYLLDDYTRFPTMEEVVREFVKGVGISKQNNGTSLLKVVTDELDKGYFDIDPLILLDGVPVFKSDKLILLDPLKVRKVEVLKKQYFYDSLTFGGIISFNTYNGDLGGFDLDSNYMTIDYQGLQLQREFYSPVYDTQEEILSRIPDFRSLLFWDPEVITDTNGGKELSFYTSDRKGKYVGVIQGLSKDGLCGYITFSFEVK